MRHNTSHRTVGKVVDFDNRMSRNALWVRASLRKELSGERIKGVALVTTTPTTRGATYIIG